MRLELYRDNLKEIVTVLRSSLSKGGVKPIFEHFLFDVKDKKLTIKATDTKVASIFSCNVESTGDFTFTLNGSTLASLLSTLDEDLIVFDYNNSTNDVKLTCGKYKLDASSCDVAEFPNISIPKNLKTIKLPDSFTNMLKSVSFSIGDDISKKDLNSLCMDINKDNSGNLALVSTDRIRLSFSSAKMEDCQDAVRFIIPKNSVEEIERFEPTHMMYGPDKQRVYFTKDTSSGNFIFQTVLTNVVYPDIYTYLTEDFGDGKVIKMKRRDMLRVLKRIRLTSDRQNKSGTLDFSETSMTLSALSASNKSKEEIEIQTPRGTPDSFSINIDFVMDYLNQETAEDIDIKVIGNSCLVFDKENYRHVLAVNS